MGKPYDLSCLGQPVLRGPDLEPIRFRVQKHLALLVYLAAEPSAHRRDHLTDLLWPGPSTPQTRQSLATALSVIRAKIPGALESTRERVRLHPEVLDLDIRRLEAGRLVPEPGIPSLDLAGFLADFDIPDAPAFMHWRDGQRAHWLPHIRAGLLTLIDHCRRTGDSGGMEGHAERLLRLDDLAEEGILARMEARALAGDRVAALRIYEEWAERAAQELGLAPSAALEGMALRLRRRGWDRTTRVDIPPVQTDQWRGRPFVGRAVEYRILYETWERMRGGSPSHVLVEGDSGVGKSTLVARLATAAGLAGATSARVQCFELEQSIPYATISGLLQALLDRPGANATPPEALAELGRTMGEIRRRFTALPPPSETTGEAARIHFAEAAQELIRAVMDEHPLILIIDDIHLADEASLAVLHLIFRWIEAGPLTVLLTSRPAAAGASPNATRLRRQAEDLSLQVVGLEPMPEEDASALLDTLLDPEATCPSPTQRRALLRASAGYPMVLELLVHDWVTRGPASVGLAVDAMTEDMAAGPPDVAYRRLFERVMDALDPPGLSVLKLAAILDRRLNELENYSLVDLTPGQTLVGLAEPVRCRALRDGGVGSGGLEFVNQAIRAQAYLSVPPTLRRTLHGQVADRLLSLDDGRQEVAGLEIAWHCTRSGRAKEAIPHLVGARARRSAMGLHTRQSWPCAPDREYCSNRTGLKRQSSSPRFYRNWAGGKTPSKCWDRLLLTRISIPGTDPNCS